MRPHGEAAMKWVVIRLSGAAALAAFFAPVPSASALIVAGGGHASTDCLSVFSVGDTVTLTTPTHIVCVDGDPSCDADGVINGSCQIPVGICANSTQVSHCSLNGVESIEVQHADDNGDPQFDPELQALQTRVNSGINPPTAAADQCTTPTNFHVAIKGPFKNRTGANVCMPNTKVVHLVTTSMVINGRLFTDRDTLRLTCVPNPADCDPQQLFAGTFDRIQTQIFTQSCALSHCHDSQTHSGGMLLESGAAYTNLVNVDPSNGSALAAGWKRVAPGDSANSFLYHKVRGALPNPSYGLRMPRLRPRLNRTLIDIIQLWIDAGAPQTGWVAGTD
jgi:hypothetical protein